MNRWLREPLLHFIALGVVIFIAYGLVGEGEPDERDIVVTRGQQAHLVTTFTRTWQRPPTQEEFDALVQDWIRQEIAWREGSAMGLDTDDIVIRRRMRQKLELLAEDVVTLAEPTEADLQAFLEANPGDYVREPRYSLRQVYFSPDRRGEEAARDAEQALVLLATDDPALDPAQLGDPLPLPYQLDGESEGAVARQFGGSFAAALSDLPEGEWAGPVPSGYGLHLVRVEARDPGRALSLDEARDAVVRDLEHRRRQDAIDELYERLAGSYSITVQPLDGEATGP